MGEPILHVCQGGSPSSKDRVDDPLYQEQLTSLRTFNHKLLKLSE